MAVTERPPGAVFLWRSQGSLIWVRGLVGGRKAGPDIALEQVFPLARALCCRQFLIGENADMTQWKELLALGYYESLVMLSLGFALWMVTLTPGWPLGWLQVPVAAVTLVSAGWFGWRHLWHRER